MNRSHGIPAWVDFATDPCTSKWKDRFRAAGAFLGQPPPARVTLRAAPLPSRAIADKIDVDVFVGRPMVLEIVQERRPVRLEAVCLEVAQGNENPWSMPTSVGMSSAVCSTSHSATPRRVQYLRGLGGGGTSMGGDAPLAA